MVRLSSPDKVLRPQDGLTKRDLRDYLLAAEDRLLAQLADRPLSTRQHPRGVEAEGRGARRPAR